MILTGDLGGTYTRLALYENHQGQLRCLFFKLYENMAFPALEEVLKTFFAEPDYPRQGRHLEGACLSIAGPVRQEQSMMTNLGWLIQTSSLLRDFPHLQEILLMNDLEALAYSLPFLDETECLPLNPVASQSKPWMEETGVRGLIAPGTGLGQAYLVEDKPLASEGGHCDFAPHQEEDLPLWRWLKKRFDHPSWERILSGPGLQNLWAFHRQHRGLPPEEPFPEPAWISLHGLRQDCPDCRFAVDTFLRLLGAEAGNLALKGLTLGGIYFGGGILPHLRPLLDEGQLQKAFVDKGRFQGLLESIPLWLVVHPQAQLLGAANWFYRSKGRTRP